MSIFLFIVILVILVVSHEFGHFIIAKRAGIRVDEFAFGFPPKLFSVKKGETTYSFNLLPIGGFVRIYGENPEEVGEEDPDKSRSFGAQPRWIQSAVIVGGVFFNFLLAWILISISMMFGVFTMETITPEGYTLKDQNVAIVGVVDGGPAALAGLDFGDRILSLEANGVTVDIKDEEQIVEFVNGEGASGLDLTYQRQGEEFTTSVLPEDGILEDRKAIGIYMDKVGILQLPVHTALWEGAKHTWFLTKIVGVGLYGFFSQLFAGETDLSAVTGPVGIVGMVGDASGIGLTYLLTFTAIISINLAIINLLPFPALDGGRLVFVIIEAIKRSPINPRVANALNITGFVLLLLLMVAVTYNDILNIFVK